MKAPALIRCLFSALILLLATLLPAVTVRAAPEIWAKEIDRLTAADVTNPPPTGGVVFVGSSSIRLWTTLAQDFPDIATINRGFGGSELADSVFYADRIVIPYRPRLVVLFAGTNDLKNGKAPETVLAAFKAFRAKLHKALPDTRLIYLAITLAPSRAQIHEQMRTANRLIASNISTDPRCTYLDINASMIGSDGLIPDSLFVEDRLHLNREGYAIWTKILAPYLKP